MAPPVESDTAAAAANKGDVQSGTQYLESHKSSLEVQDYVKDLYSSNKDSYRQVMDGIYGNLKTDSARDSSLIGLLPTVEFADSKTSEAINPQGVQQGAVGDCFFEASLSSLANTKDGQETIKNMVKNNNDGSYTVTFPGDTKHPVTVSDQEITELKNRGDVKDSNQTISIIETAFQKYDRAGVYGAGINAWANDLSGQQTSPILQIHDAGSALHLLTGKDTSSEGIGFANVSAEFGMANKDNVERFIQSALERGEPVVAASNLASNTLGNIFASEPIAARHEYSVLGYDPKTQTVTVRNPWGTNDGTGVGPTGSTADGITNIGNGEMQMSLDTFMKDLNAVTAAGVNPHENRLRDLANDVSNGLNDFSNTLSNIAGGDFDSVLNSAGQVVQDEINFGTDIFTSAANTGKSVMGAVVRETYDTASETVKNTVSAINDALPWNW